MHSLLPDETGLWKMDLLVDTSDSDKVNLVALAKKYNIPMADIKTRFIEMFIEEEELTGCAKIQYRANLNSFQAELFFTEHLHNQDIEITAMVRDLRYPLPFVVLSFEEEYIESECKKKGGCKTRASSICKDIKMIIEKNFLKENKEIEDKEYNPLDIFQGVLLKPNSQFIKYENQLNECFQNTKVTLYNLEYTQNQAGVCCLVKKIQDKKIVSEPLSVIQTFSSKDYLNEAKEFYGDLETFVKKYYLA